jgi:hypothetical protein
MLRRAVRQPVDLRAPPLQAGMRDVVTRAARRFANLRIDDVQRSDGIALVGRRVEQREVAHRAGRRGAVQEGYVDHGLPSAGLLW